MAYEMRGGRWSKGQSVPKIAPCLVNPHSRLGINLLHGVLNIASKPAIRGLAAKLLASEPDGPNLPRYVELPN